MRAVWAGEPGPVRVREVLDDLNRRRRKPLAYNTVQTVLTILKDKGAVRVVDGPGRAHHYRARITRAEASRRMVDELIDRLFDGRVHPLLQQLIDDPKLTPADLKELRDWVEAKLRDSEGDGA